ncbi:M3 family metallopeptidase [Sphingomonas sp. MMS24-JH45]
MRKAKYDLNQDELKPYFEITNVLEKGVFEAATQMYGITFESGPRPLPSTSPTSPSTRCSRATARRSASPISITGSATTSAAAWMSNFVGQSKLFGTKPVVYNVANFTKPAAGQPALVTFDDVSTMFHEFGHALHGLFANQTYPSVSGTAVARDFVEFPSQFNEHWALDPKVLPKYAVHYQTKQVIPPAMVERINAPPASTPAIGSAKRWPRRRWT